MDDIVDEKYEWEVMLWEEEEALEALMVSGVDWEVAEELLAIDRGDAPSPPYPIVAEGVAGKIT